MIKIDVNSELPKAMERLKAVESKQWPFILTQAINETAFAVLKDMREVQLPAHIDNPTRQTIQSMRVRKAKKSKDLNAIDAIVDWKSGLGLNPGASAGEYLRPLVEGGQRPQKRSEKALEYAGILPKGWVMVPTDDAGKDANGNVSGGVYNRILSYFKANPDSMQNTTKRSKKKNVRRQNFHYFAAIKGQRGWKGPSGIYERATFAFGSALRLLFAFVPRATYKEQFDFYGLGKKKATQVFPAALNKYIDVAIRTKK